MTWNWLPPVARPEGVQEFLLSFASPKAAGPDAMQHNLRAHAQAAGVDPQRLMFAPQLPQAQHLARLQLADLSLDTLPCNAHTIASDALWAVAPHCVRQMTAYVHRQMAAWAAASDNQCSAFLGERQSCLCRSGFWWPMGHARGCFNAHRLIMP